MSDVSDVILFIDDRSPQTCLLFILEGKSRKNKKKIVDGDERCDDERVFYFKPYE